jgi:FkbM family methyltransferase
MTEDSRSTLKHDDLVYDVGMHKGEDADFYIRKGFRVIGFEADPHLVEECRTRFISEILHNRVTIIEGAIIDLLSPDINTAVTFFRNIDNSVWGTVVPDWAHRNEVLGTSNEIIRVPIVDFSDCLRKYGIPHYLKTDIEGMDTVCIRALKDFELKPDYVSMESEKVVFEKLKDEINLLTQLGYTRFKAIQQWGISRQKEPNPSREGCYLGYHFYKESSGLFGADLPGKWKNSRQIIRQYKLIFLQYRLFGDYGIISKYKMGEYIVRIISKILRKPIPGWYDTHAKHSSVKD